MKNATWMAITIAFLCAAVSVAQSVVGSDIPVRVKQGDTVSELAEELLGTAKADVVQVVIAHNSLPSDGKIIVGQHLRFPTRLMTEEKRREILNLDFVQAELQKRSVQVQPETKREKEGQSGGSNHLWKFLCGVLGAMILLMAAFWRKTHNSLGEAYYRDLRSEEQLHATTARSLRSAEAQLKDVEGRSAENEYINKAFAKEVAQLKEKLKDVHGCLRTAEGENKALHDEVAFFKDEAIGLLNQTVSNTRNLPEWLAKQFRLMEQRFSELMKFFIEFLAIKQQLMDLRTTLQAVASVKPQVVPSENSPSADQTAEALKRVEESLVLFSTAFGQIGSNEERVMRLLGLAVNENKGLVTKVASLEQQLQAECSRTDGQGDRPAMLVDLARKGETLTLRAQALFKWEQRVQEMLDEARRIQAMAADKWKSETRFNQTKTYLTNVDKRWLLYENEIYTLQLKVEMLEGKHLENGGVVEVAPRSTASEFVIPEYPNLDQFLSMLAEAEPGTVCEFKGMASPIPVVVVSRGINTFAVNDQMYLNKLRQGKVPPIEKKYRCLDSSHQHKPEFDDDELYLHFKEEHCLAGQIGIAS